MIIVVGCCAVIRVPQSMNPNDFADHSESFAVPFSSMQSFSSECYYFTTCFFIIMIQSQSLLTSESYPETAETLVPAGRVSRQLLIMCRGFCLQVVFTVTIIPDLPITKIPPFWPLQGNSLCFFALVGGDLLSSHCWIYSCQWL